MSKKGKKGGGAGAGQNLASLSPAEKLKAQGNDSFQNRNFEKAKEFYTQAIELEQNHIFYSNRSACFFELEQYFESLEDAEKAISINSQYWKAYIRKALALRELDQIEKGIATLEEALKIDENDTIKGSLDILMKEKKETFELPKDDPERMNIEKLLNWLKNGESKFPKLKIQFYEKNYRGVHAAMKIKAKDQILFVPKSHLITLEMARATEVGKKIKEAELDLLSPKHSFLSTFLLQERKNKDSHWKPYLDLLPSDYNSFPVFFTDEELYELEGSPFYDQVKDKKADLKRDYDAIVEVAPEFSEHSFHDFCWARMSASSRIFGINIEGTKTDAFVPLADMLNHKRPKQTSWYYSDEQKGFIIESLEEIPRGEQIYDSYGRKCNSRFFLNYGFINMNNDANEVALKVSFDPSDETLATKEKMLNDVAGTKTFRILASIEEENTIEFMNYIRFVEIRDTAVLLEVMNIYESSKRHDKEEGYKPQKTPPINPKVEERTLVVVREICSKQLSRYRTSLKEDQELLKKNDLSYNIRNAILLRSGEKEILEYMIKFVDKCLPLFSMPLKQVRKVMVLPSHNEYIEYIKRVVIPIMTKAEREAQQV